MPKLWIFCKIRKNLESGVEQLVLGKLVVVQVVRIGWVFQVPWTSQSIPLNSQGTALASQRIPLAARGVSWVEEGVGSLALITAGPELLSLKGRAVQFVAVLVVPADIIDVGDSGDWW